MLQKTREFLTKHQLIQPGDHVLAACSGGPDSLALLHALWLLRDEYAFQLAAAHVDHMFRGERSAADASYVAAFCQERGICCHVTAIDVPACIRQTGKSAQDAARMLRYQYLRQVAAAWGDAKIATGHHRDDQAETVLLHLLRGAGGTGLAGIRPAAGGIIRPLLAVSRQDIEAYCREQSLTPRQDSSNLETHYLRNRIRLEVIPFLERQLETNIREQLCRTAKLAGDDQEFLSLAAGEKFTAVVREEADAFRVNCKELLKLHISLKRQIFRMIIEKKQGSLRGISFYHVEKLIEMTESWSVGAKLQLPGGLAAEKEYGAVRIGSRRSEPPACIAPPGVMLTHPFTEIPQLDISVAIRVLSEKPAVHSPWSAVFDRDIVKEPLFVRTRLPGDRFVPSGMQGTKKLKDFFIDAKIARQVRDRVPVFCDSLGNIFWLGGLRQAEYGRVTDATRQFVEIVITK